MEMFFEYGADWQLIKQNAKHLKALANKVRDIRKYSVRAADILLEDLLKPLTPTEAKYITKELQCQNCTSNHG